MKPSPIKIKLHDTKTNKLVLLPPNQRINIYLCGPTVYDDLHIGNIRNIVLLNALSLFLKESQYEVKYVQNITDIDDKIIKKAQELKIDETDLANKFFEHYLELLQNLEIFPPFFVKVSEHLPLIITFIEQLLKKQIAYESTDGIYFDISKFPQNYGIFKNLKLDQKQPQSSDEISPKKHFEDFALWKKKDYGKRWDSPWGKGRPGWHTECAAIIWQNFEQGVTIHAGGIDLLFPHHENERIQFYALKKKEIAKIWMHNGFVNFENQKISKSKKQIAESFLAKDWIKKYSSNTIKFWFFLTPYRKDLNFNSAHLLFCEKLETKIVTIFKKVNLYAFIHNNSLKKGMVINSEYQKFTQILSEDFDTVNAIDLITRQIKKLSRAIDSKNWDVLLDQKTTIEKELKLLGIKINLPEITKEIQKMIQDWQKALHSKKYNEADQIREKLKKLFIL